MKYVKTAATVAFLKARIVSVLSVMNLCLQQLKAFVSLHSSAVFCPTTGTKFCGKCLAG